MAVSIQELRENLPVQRAENVSVGFTTLQGFELAQRAAKALSQSTLVPKEYQGNLPNCIVALNMAQRLNADPLMVMQNLVIVHGRPTWSAQFLISTANSCGHFSALRYEWKGKEGTDEWACRAWAIEKATGERLEGSWVSIALAKKEGWYQKNGSKWQTMPQQMLMYRAGSWWVRAYAPELSMGLTTAEEARDFIDITPEHHPITVQDVANGPESAPAPEPVATDDIGVDVEPIPDFDPELARDDLVSLIEAADTKDELYRIKDLPVYQQLKAEHPGLFAEVNKAASAALGRVK